MKFSRDRIIEVGLEKEEEKIVVNEKEIAHIFVNQFERNLLSSSFYHGLIERHSIFIEKVQPLHITFCAISLIIFNWSYLLFLQNSNFVFYEPHQICCFLKSMFYFFSLLFCYNVQNVSFSVIFLQKMQNISYTIY